MFGQSISGNVDMDGNGYTGMAITSFPNHKLKQKKRKKKLNGKEPGLLNFSFFTLVVASYSEAIVEFQTRDRGILFTAFHS